MTKSLPVSLARTIFAIAFIAGFFSVAQKANAQYCIPGEDLPSYMTYYCWSDYYWDNYGFEYYYHAWFTNVKVVDMNNTSDVRLERSSDNDGCYINTEVEGRVFVGKSYDVQTVRYQNYYNAGYYTYNTIRMWVDWGIDGSFEEDEDFIYQNTNYPNNDSDRFYVRGQQSHNFTFKIDIPSDNPLGKTRMRLATSYYYPYPTYAWWNDACINGYYYDNGSYGYMYSYGEVEDYILDISIGLKDLFPDDNDILFAGENYNGETRTWQGQPYYYERPFVEFLSTQPSGSQMRYSISGPLPGSDEVYVALDGSGNEWIDVGTGATMFQFTNSTGSKSPNGDGAFMSSNGGVYRVNLQMKVPGIPNPLNIFRIFTVAWNNDLQTRDIVSPKTNQEPYLFKYLIGNIIPVTGKFQNVGLNPVTSFDATARLYYPNGDLFQEFSTRWDANDPGNNPLQTGQEVEISFGTVRIQNAGTYTVEMCADLLNAVDQEAYNDCLPRPDQGDHTIEITYEIQLQSYDVMKPSSGEELIGSRPLRPRGIFRNVGIGDASEVPATMVVTNSAGDEVYRSDLIVQDIPSGKYNTRAVNFDIMQINETGNYTLCIIISAPEDVVSDDDTLCINFSVKAGLSGTYTIGTTNSGSSRNYATIEDAMEDVYLLGLAGSTLFEFTDANYTTSSPYDFMPAWDFTTNIIGLGKNEETGEINTLTFKPSRTRSLQRGGVTINLEAGNGQGIRFGQSVSPAYQYAVYNEFAGVENANGKGYIIFDGGDQKSLRFVLNSKSQGFGSAFYLGTGASNITIQNTLIENNTSWIANNSRLPVISYDPQLGFAFGPDSTILQGGGVTGYSAGVTMRSKLLSNEEQNFTPLDSLPNTYNVIDNNEISGFGYGVVSLGYGALFLNGDAKWQEFYNMDNTISNNYIYDVARAGIFLGNEDMTTVKNNRIEGVENTMYDVAGIWAGGMSQGEILGYNNTRLTLDGNEVSGLRSPSMMTGIRLEQTRTEFLDAIQGVVHFPRIDENNRIVNNVVWGFNPNSASAGRAGIHVFTERDRNGGINDARFPDYWTNNDEVVNNTVIINSDQGLINTGAVVGIGLQHTDNAQLYNNAIAILDDNLDQNSPVASGILYQGHFPGSGEGLISDRNALWFDASRSNANFGRFVEMEGNAIVESGYRNEFRNLSQWQQWTGADLNSVFGNFTTDLQYAGNAPQKLRINRNPLPLGSILDNRGERFSWLETDIDGTIRGQAGQRYDIGAEEFSGDQYVIDLEVVSIPTPGEYRSSVGTFSDAEYIMTKAPIEVISRIRNNGTVQANGIEVTVNIYMENSDGNFPTSPSMSETVEINVGPSETVNVPFLLADGQGDDFNPQTYAELPSYAVPQIFTTMSNNVTPRYKIEVILESDQRNANNESSKEVRFYLHKSELNILFSVENSFSDINGSSDVDAIAGNLNYDALMTGFNDLGWNNDDEINIDNFDRLGWEPRAVNYSYHQSLFWTDGDDKPFTRLQTLDVENFLMHGDNWQKKNLVAFSQEAARSNPGSKFVNDYLRASNVAPGNPMGAGVSNDGNSVIGYRVQRDLEEFIRATGYTNDAEPYCGLVSVIEEGEGLAGVAYNYVNTDASVSETTMGVATSTLTTNQIALMVDTRHFADMESVLRGVIDYIENNGGYVIPVELLSFDAERVSNHVELNWVTASEYNTARFEVERAVEGEAGLSEFVRIDEVSAAGKSSSELSYGPVVDNKVEFGSTYAYRLKMVDLNGEWEYSGERYVTMTADGGYISLSEAMPNPAVNETKFEYTTSGDMAVTFEVYDMSGSLVGSYSQNGGSKNIFTLDVMDMSSGTYTVVMRAGDASIIRSVNVVR